MAETKTCPYCGEEILEAAKKCKHCGEWLEEKPKKQIPCEICGEMIDEDAKVCPYCHEKVISNAPEEVSQPVVEQTKASYKQETPQEPKTNEAIESYEDEEFQGVFVNYYLDVIRNHYSDFNRSVTRKEYWLFVLFNVLVSWALMCLAFLNFQFALVISTLYSLGVLLPSLAMAVGRLRDINKKWTNLFFSLIPIVGPIILLVFLCRKGKKRNIGAVRMAILDYVIIVLAIVGIIALTRAQAQMMSTLLGDYGETSSFSQLLNNNAEESSAFDIPKVEALVEVITQQANLRTGPGTDYAKYGDTCMRNDILWAFEQQDGWWHVFTWNGNTAWISSSVTKVVDSGPIPESKFGEWFVQCDVNIMLLKPIDPGKYKGCVIMYDEGNGGSIGKDEKGEFAYAWIKIGKTIPNGIVFPYSLGVITREKPELSNQISVTSTYKSEYGETIEIEISYGKAWRSNLGWFNPLALSKLNEDDIALMLSKAKKMDFVQNICNENIGIDCFD